MLLSRTLKVTALLICMVGMFFGVTVGLHADDSTEAKIASAMSAAPMAIGHDATILDFPADPAKPMIVLQQGTNGWTCYPDYPGTPGNDPQCLDATWMKWNDAFNAGKAPEITTPGIAYMLQGGSDASNTDPLAVKPAAGEDWVTTPPHIMILFPGKLDTKQFTTDHHSGLPYIMWAGTPYEHIMAPISLEEASMK